MNRRLFPPFAALVALAGAIVVAQTPPPANSPAWTIQDLWVLGK